MVTAHINIGSNLGDSHRIIARAVAGIRCIRGVGDVTVSDSVESEPWGFESEHRFVNTGVMLETSLGPEQLLHALQQVERDTAPGAHRNPDGTYADRALDIDLIAMGQLVCDTPELQLPHPRMHLRPFVLQPMVQLDPEWEHPLLHLTPGAMLTRLLRC